MSSVPRPAPDFTPQTLPPAVRSLLELNHFSVEGPLQISGAEIDLIATPKTIPLMGKLYIEVTTSY